MPERKRVASHPHTEKKVSAIKESTEAKPNFSVLGLEKAERGYNPSKEWAEANGGSAGLVRAGVERFSKEFSTKKLRSFLFGFGKNLSALTMEGGKDFIREEVAKKHFTAEQQADFEKTVNEVIEKASERLGKSAERIDKIKEELDRQEIEKLGVQLYRRLKCLKAILDDCEGTATPYTSTSEIDKRLGFHWKDAEKTSVLNDEISNLLVFTKEREVIAFFDYPRYEGDFINIEPKTFSKNDARFKLKEEKNGIQKKLFFYSFAEWSATAYSRIFPQIAHAKLFGGALGATLILIYLV